jgi:hypothetical protein
VSGPGSIYVPPGSRLRGFAETVAWLWRLGPVLDSPDRAMVGLGWQDEAADLQRLLRAGSLAGAVVFATRPGPGDGSTPSRARRMGTASFGRDRRVSGQFYVLDGGGEPVVRSSLGVHAVRDDAWMVLGADPDGSWGALDAFWVLATLADFMVDVLDRPLVMLPPVGWARYDDVPGTAYHQLGGRAKSDRKMRRRVERVAERFAELGMCLNVAITPATLLDGREAPIDEVWPEAIAAIQRGVREGSLEPVCHGYLHLDTEAWAAGKISPREFENVGREEADRRLEIALAWIAGRFGEEQRTFVAPTWAYGEGLLAALAEREVPTWLPPELGPLVAANTARETVFSRMDGLTGLDYGPFGALAGAGLPPSVVVHGGLFDSRAKSLLDPRQVVTTARLVHKRDLFRAPWVEGVRWIGAGELVERLRAHDRVGVSDSTVHGPEGTEVVVRDRAGSRTVAIGDRGHAV